MDGTQKAENDVPDRAGVYVIQRNNEILYVGQSKSIKQRCSQYVITNDPEVEVAYEILESRKERLRKERELIEEHEPRLNKNNNASRNKYDRRVILDET